MIKILEEKKRITVNDNNITVTAKISLNDLIYTNPEFIPYFCMIMISDVEFTGIAHLHEGDESNVLEATRIAEAKMERKFYQFVKRSQKKLINQYLPFLDIVKKDSKKTDKALTRIDEHIKEICNRL